MNIEDILIQISYTGYPCVLEFNHPVDLAATEEITAYNSVQVRAFVITIENEGSSVTGIRESMEYNGGIQ